MSDSVVTVICFSSWRWFLKLSCKERPAGRLLTFVPGHVETCIPAITARHSLLPASSPASLSAHLTMRFPSREQYGVPTFRYEKCAGLGACFRPGSPLATETQSQSVSPASIPFWFKRTNHFRLLCITIFITDSDIFTLPAI